MTVVTMTLLWVEAEHVGGEKGLSAALDAHGATVEPAVGAARLATFASAQAALHCAVDLQRSSEAVRVGIHSADLERRDAELRGPAILKTARIAALARPGQVLASSVVVELAGLTDASELWFDEGDEVELRGLRGRHRVAALRWEARRRESLRIVVADDSAIVRDGIAALLREHALDVVATAGDARELHAAIERHLPDLALVDIRMPPTFTTEGLDAAELIGQAHPEVGVLVLSQHVDAGYAMRLVGEGRPRRGYLLKDRVTDVAVLLDAVHRVARGGCVVDPGLSARMIDHAQAMGGLDELSEREREVLGLIAEGLSNRGIAERLVLAARTVETHVGQIFLKLGLREQEGEHRRVAAVLAYLRATG